MTVIALESELVRTGFDPKTGVCYYTIQRNGQRWTVSLPINDLHKHKNRQAKRNHLASALTVAMRGTPDPNAGTRTDPFKPATWQEFDKLPVGAWYLNPADGTLQQKISDGKPE